MIERRDDVNIIEIIDRLEFMVVHARKMPLTANVMLNEDEMLDLIDQLRLNLPEAVQAANQTMQERQRLLSEAQTDATRITQQAHEQAQLLVQESEVVRTAEGRAAELIRESSLKAAEVRRQADDYAVDVMQQLEAQLMRTVATVKKGLDSLKKTPVG